MADARSREPELSRRLFGIAPEIASSELVHLAFQEIYPGNGARSYRLTASTFGSV